MDASGHQVGWIRLDPSQNSFVIPAAQAAAMRNIGDGSLAGWRVQTGYYSGNSINALPAAGDSGLAPLPAP
jgi:hypothetical protein